VIKLNRGYAGFYKEHYLRSSYEYAYAKYLDYHSIPWSYEDKVFDLGYKLYKPDFFFYDQNGKIIKIVEIKSRDKKAKDNALKALSVIESKHNIPCELVSYEELLSLYSDLPFSLTATITEWINSKDTTISKAAYGSLNGHFNLKHSEAVKKKIGESTKQRWASDSDVKRRMKEGLRKSGLAQKGKHKVPRVLKRCLDCGKPFIVLNTSIQLYCSQHCAGNAAIKIATDVYVQKRKTVHQNIRDYIISWSKENKHIVLSTPLNKIKPTLQPLLQNIQELFDVKDIRVISKAVFGEDRGRKELIMFMKKVCNENVC